MLERLIIAVVLTVLGIVAYQIFNRWRVGRARITASYDPLMFQFQMGRPGIILFTADYCYPCKMQQQPAITRLVEQVGEDKVQVIEVDVEAHPETAQRWGVLSLPTTFVLDRDGKPHEVNHGVTSTDKLRRQIEALA